MVVAQVSNFIPGQIVRCVATDAVGLTKGKYYKVISVRDGWIVVVTDFGVESSYAEGRFRLAARDIAASTWQGTGLNDTSGPDYLREQAMLRALNKCRGNRQVILVVEGNPVTRASAAEQLRDLNYVALEASDANQAEELLRSDPTIELLFTDAALPKGGSGFNLARACQNYRPDVKILLTAELPVSWQASDTVGAMEWPVIGKPYGLLELASHITTLLTRSDEPLFLGPFLRPRPEPLFLGPYLRHA